MYYSETAHSISWGAKIRTRIRPLTANP